MSTNTRPRGEGIMAELVTTPVQYVVQFGGDQFHVPPDYQHTPPPFDDEDTAKQWCTDQVNAALADESIVYPQMYPSYSVTASSWVVGTDTVWGPQQPQPDDAR